jgi:hypothetical protein
MKQGEKVRVNGRGALETVLGEVLTCPACPPAVIPVDRGGGLSLGSQREVEMVPVRMPCMANCRAFSEMEEGGVNYAACHVLRIRTELLPPVGQVKTTLKVPLP